MVELSNSFYYRLLFNVAVHNPQCKHWVCPSPRSLAATWGISFDLYSSWYLDVSVPKVRSPQGDIYLYMPGCPIQKSTDQSFLAAPRGLSQPSTSFIASISQGIHH